MKKVFEKPQTIEELYEFFLYSMPLTPISRRYHWSSSINRYNYARRRGWQIYVRNQPLRDFIVYRSGTSSRDIGWRLNVYRQT